MLEVFGKLTASLLVIACTALFSGMLFGPGDVPKQLFVVAMWFCAGWIVNGVWHG